MAPVPIRYRCWDGPEFSSPTAGYQHHRAAGETPCPACRAAAAQYQQDRRLAPKRRAILDEAVAASDGRSRRQRRDGAA